MAEEGLRPIIVKKIKKGGGGHHGGAWKIAYADFVTAMMAFFLLMWLLGSTTKGDLNGISEYFKTPLKVAMQGGSGSGDSSSVIQGGGSDLSRRTGQVKMTDDPAQTKSYNLDAAKKALEAEEKSRLQALRARIEMTIDTNAELKKFKEQLLLDFTSEGLRIQIVDQQNRPMFNAGKADLQPYAGEILEAIAPVLNDVPNKIGRPRQRFAPRLAAWRPGRRQDPARGGPGQCRPPGPRGSFQPDQSPHQHYCDEQEDRGKCAA
jgi:chemotaxis protein MotB